MLKKHMQNIGRDQLKGLNTAARGSLQAMQQLYSSGNIAHLGKGRAACDRQGKQLHRCGCNHTKRSLRADEQVTQIIASIILAKPTQHVQNLATHQNDLKPQGELPRGAIPNNIQPPGIGAKIAADCAASLGG